MTNKEKEIFDETLNILKETYKNEVNVTIEHETCYKITLSSNDEVLNEFNISGFNFTYNMYRLMNSFKRLMA